MAQFKFQDAHIAFLVLKIHPRKHVTKIVSRNNNFTPCVIYKMNLREKFIIMLITPTTFQLH